MNYSKLEKEISEIREPYTQELKEEKIIFLKKSWDVYPNLKIKGKIYSIYMDNLFKQWIEKRELVRSNYVKKAEKKFFEYIPEESLYNPEILLKYIRLIGFF